MPDDPTTQQVESPTYTTTQATNDLAKLTEQIIKLVPNVVPELIKGNTPAELIDSIEQSRAVFDRYFPNGVAAAATPARTTTAKEPAAAAAVTPTPPAVPAGGVAFTDDIDKLPPMELIKRGMAQVRANHTR